MVGPKICIFTIIFIILQQLQLLKCDRFSKVLLRKIVAKNTSDVANYSMPFIASVQVKQLAGFSHICGGIIIHRHFVLTAAHCFLKYKLGPKAYRVCTGTNQIYGSDAISLPVEAFVAHKMFLVEGGNDIALIKLAENIPLFNNAILKSISWNNDYTADRLKAYLLGWGRQQRGVKKHLEQMNFTTMDNKQCMRSGFYLLTKRELCALNTSGRSACDGDSGGPLVDTTYSIVYGLLSYGRRACQRGMPYVFTRISAHQLWIREQMIKLDTPQQRFG